ACPRTWPILSNAKINRSAFIFGQSVTVCAAARGCHFSPVVSAIDAARNPLATSDDHQAKFVFARQYLVDVRIRQAIVGCCPALTLIAAKKNTGNLDAGK